MSGLLDNRGLSFLINTVNFFFPGVCPLCGERMYFTDIICKDCKLKLDRTPMMKLGMKLKYIDSVWCYGKYEDDLSKAIKMYKYGSFVSFHRLFADFVVRILKESNLNFNEFIITSVPPTMDSLLIRGFDHTKMIAERVSKILNIEYKMLIKAKNKRAQVELDMNERKRNVVGKYRLKMRNIPKKIIIFDDVVTTGSTLMECGKILKKAGSDEVHGLVIACSSFL